MLAVGFENGLIGLLNARSGVSLCNPIRLVSLGNVGVDGKVEVKGLSFDATGRFLGAVNEVGKSAVFEFVFTSSSALNLNLNSHQNRTSSQMSGMESDELRIVPGSIHAYHNVHR